MKERLVWLDVVRFIAMFAVVMCHCCDPFNFTPSVTDPALKLCGAVYGCLLRPCVPLFVMITGALLLPVKQDAGPFYKKRITRVLWPFLIWSVLYCMFPFITKLLGLKSDVILAFFPYASEALQQQSLSLSLINTAKIALNFGEIDAHMWYIYLLIGLYLYMPLFSAWVEKASDKAKRWFFVAWGITLFVPFYREYVDPYLWGACSWNEFYALYYFAGFNGYLLAGHYLRHHRQSLIKVLLWGIPSFIIGYAITFAGYYPIALNPQSTPEQLELFFYFLSPNVVMMTLPIFALCMHVEVRNERIKLMLANLTTCGFGVYMIHFFLTGPCIWLMRSISCPLYLQIPIAAVIAFAMAWLITLLLRKVFGKYAHIVVG